MNKTDPDRFGSGSRRFARREFLTGAAAISSALLAGPGAVFAAHHRKLDKIGIQLYTVRDRMATDVPGTLEKIASIGYDEVEFFDYFKHAPVDLRRMLDDTGLVAPSTHVELHNMRETPDETIEAAHTLGHDYVVLGWVAPEERKSLDDYKAHIELFNRFAEKCRSAGLQYAYHNHDFEFALVDGIRPIDLILAETDPKLVQIEMDFYWITKGGGDPFALFEQYPGRFPLCHIKDMNPDGSMADVGAGKIDFAGLLAAGDQAGFQHYYVERDDPPDSIISADISYTATAELEF